MKIYQKKFLSKAAISNNFCPQNSANFKDFNQI